MPTRTSVKPAEVRPVATPVRKLAPVVVVDPKMLPRSERTANDWLIAIVLACICAFVVMFVAYVLRPAATTVADSSTQTWSGDQP